MAQVCINPLCGNPLSTQPQRVPNGKILTHELTVTVTKHTRKPGIRSKSQQQQQVVDLDPQRPQKLELSDIRFTINLAYLRIFLKCIENISEECISRKVTS